MIRITPTSRPDHDVWNAILDLAETNAHWTLIGARMVELHALEHTRPRPRVSLDLDVLVDARAKPGATRDFARMLAQEGFAMDEPATLGVGFAFRKGAVAIDVLAPDGLNSRSRRQTIPPAYTVEVPGGTQALHRSESVEVAVGQRSGLVRRPNLLGAILLKLRAIEVDDAKENQRSDAALLLSLVQDPDAIAAEISRSERSWVRRHPELDSHTARCWASLEPDAVQRGLVAFRRLAA